MRVHRLQHISLTSADATELSRFYERALGFHAAGSERYAGAAFEQLLQVAGGARAAWLSLGAQRLELLQFDTPGRSYPPQRSASDLAFQHFALVVTDIGRALEQLHAVAGWSAISSPGPQRLPARSGGVTAFKFRDPEGHPLELLQFSQLPPRWRKRATQPPSSALGVDHSAISVAESARSIHFYEALGLTVTGRSFNVGEEQARLDGLHDPHVQVTALSPPLTPPHVELLCYERHGAGGEADGAAALRSNDVAATRLVFETDLPSSQSRRDPDGHHLLLLASPQPRRRRAAAPASSTA